jgi:hypothetical protein
MSEPATSVQPSTRTKKISLNGSDTTTGGNIIMPIDMSTEATTRSMIRNGRNNRKSVVSVAFGGGIMSARRRLRDRRGRLTFSLEGGGLNFTATVICSRNIARAKARKAGAA